MGYVQSSNKMISHWCLGPYPRYFDSLQHVALRRAYSWYHFEVATTKVTTCRGDQNDNKTITKTITFGVKNGPCETLPTFDDVYLVLGIPDMNHCS